jgi:hypothetical protein
VLCATTQYQLQLAHPEAEVTGWALAAMMLFFGWMASMVLTVYWVALVFIHFGKELGGEEEEEDTETDTD